MQAGPLDPKDLHTLARQAHEAGGLTQVQAAQQLGVTPASYAQALSKRPGLDALRRRIVEAFTPYRVDGPQYVLVEKEEQAR